jgi:dolichol kinase
MAQANFLEIRRGIFHALFGIGIILLILFFQYARIVLFAACFIGVILMVLARNKFIPGISHGLCLFERECNRECPGKGAIFFLVSSLIVSSFFQQNIALASIAILSFGDPVSGLIGRHFGKIKIFSIKNVEGTLLGILAGTIFASLFVSAVIAFCGAFAAMAVEFYGIKIWGKTADDNLTIPIISAIIMAAII